MCSRFHLLEEHYRKALVALGVAAPSAFASRYNIAPGTAIPALRLSAPGPAYEATVLRWGLTPAWARSDEPASRLVNARAETLAAKPTFRDALRQRRCVIPASGFFEWEAIGRARKPWLFRRRDGEPFGLAGLWESWRAPDGVTIESCAVITTEPNELIRPIHNRMPVMLGTGQFAAWLDPRLAEPAQLAPFLQTPPAAAMTAFAVNPVMSNVRHEGPDCIEPAPADDDEGGTHAQLSLGL